MRFIVQAVPQRAPMVDYLRQHIPDLEVVWEDGRGIWHTFQRSLALGGADGHVHLEDDATLCVGFLERVQEICEGVPYPVQLFNRTGTHDGSRPGKTFMYTTAFYLPPKWGASLAAYCATWFRDDHKLMGGRRGQIDYMVADWLHERGLRYFQPDPPLVQHTPIPSSIPGHGGVRTSPRFGPPELRGHPYPELFEEESHAEHIN